MIDSHFKILATCLLGRTVRINGGTTVGPLTQVIPPISSESSMFKPMT